MRAILTALAGLLLSAVPAAAQSVADSAAGSRWLLGGSLGVPGVSTQVEPSLFTVGVHATWLQPRGPGVEVALGTMPRMLVSGVFAVGSRANLIATIPVGRSTYLVPGGGVSFVAGAAGEGFDGQAGVNGGVALIAMSRETGLRTGITWHRFAGFEDGGIWLVEFGFVK